MTEAATPMEEQPQGEGQPLTEEQPPAEAPPASAAAPASTVPGSARASVTAPPASGSVKASAAEPASAGTGSARASAAAPPASGSVGASAAAPAQPAPGSAKASAAAPAAPAPAKAPATRPGYYNTNVKRTREFEFRVSGKRATGMACGPSHQVVQHHLVLPSDHPAAAPFLVEEVATVMVAKMLEKGVNLKLDSRMEQSIRSMVAPGAGSKLSKVAANKPSTTGDVARYDALIAALEKNPNLNTDPEKKKALETLQSAKKNNTPLKLEELTKIVEMCSTINFIDKAQAQKLVTRMEEVGAITAEQNKEIMKDVETKYPDGKIPVEALQIMIEEKGAKKK